MAKWKQEIEVTVEWVEPPSREELHRLFQKMYEWNQEEKRLEASSTLSDAEFKSERDK